MKKRLFSWTILGVSVVFLAVGFGAPFVVLQNYAQEVGIIGGADAPTYWYIMMNRREMNGWPMCFVLSGIPMFLTAVFRLSCPDKEEECCPASTTLVTLGISAFGGSGLFFGLNMMIIVGFAGASQYPVAGPVYTALAVISLLCFVMLIFFYAFLRSVHKSRLGVFLDVVTSILYLPAFFWTIGLLFGKAEEIYRSLK